MRQTRPQGAVSGQGAAITAVATCNENGTLLSRGDSTVRSARGGHGGQITALVEAHIQEDVQPLALRLQSHVH